MDIIALHPPPVIETTTLRRHQTRLAASGEPARKVGLGELALQCAFH